MRRICKVNRIVIILILLNILNCQLDGRVYNFGSKSTGLMISVTIFLIITGCGNAITYYIVEKRSSEKIKLLKSAENTHHLLKNNSENPEITKKNLVKRVIKTEKISKIDVKVDLCKEINSQINQWVIYESARLSQRLEELSDQIDELGNVASPEIELIKNEANKISKEIEIFKKHLSDEESG